VTVCAAEVAAKISVAAQSSAETRKCVKHRVINIPCILALGVTYVGRDERRALAAEYSVRSAAVVRRPHDGRVNGR